ncbi:MAG: hypothetical protein C0475_02975 [Planctomyces sp.]|nr:hypothetical protein [Planctomyces sp.]
MGQGRRGARADGLRRVLGAVPAVRVRRLPPRGLAEPARVPLCRPALGGAGAGLRAGRRGAGWEGHTVQENDLLESIRAGFATACPHVLIGPGDDCAAVRAPGPWGGAGAVELITTDQVIGGRHVDEQAAVELIARKAVARSVSDIAAMAGTPRWCVAAGALPAGMPQERAVALCAAIARWGERFGCPVVGGDIAAVPAGSAMVLTATVGGWAHPTRGPVRRDGARVGDGVWVSGRIGASLVSGRHMTFEPRVGTAAWLAEALGARLRAMIDVSDGLGIDAARVGRASGVRVRVELDRVPMNPEVGPGRAARLAACGDGEDYELLFTAAGDAALPAADPQGVPITRIGAVEGLDDVTRAGAVIVLEGGVEIDASGLGWEHGRG